MYWGVAGEFFYGGMIRAHDGYAKHPWRDKRLKSDREKKLRVNDIGLKALDEEPAKPGGNNRPPLPRSRAIGERNKPCDAYILS